MYRAVRVSRYGCGDKAADKLTAQVFQLMRQRYPTSPWTARARRFR